MSCLWVNINIKKLVVMKKKIRGFFFPLFPLRSIDRDLIHLPFPWELHIYQTFGKEQ